MSCRSAAVIRYPGGKTVGIDVLSQYMPTKGTIFTPFLGGASVELFMALNNHPNVTIVANDLSKELFTFWKSLKKDRSRVISECRKLLGNKDWDRPKYYEVRSLVYESGKATSPFQVAAAYFLCANASFNGGIAKMYSEPSARLARLTSKLSCLEKTEWVDTALKHFKLYNLDYETFMRRVVKPGIADCMQRKRDYFVYLDPPYFVPQNHYGQGRQDKAHVFDHARFAETVLGASYARNKWLVCYNDCPYVRKLFPASRCKVRRIFYQEGMHPEVIITPKVLTPNTASNDSSKRKL